MTSPWTKRVPRRNRIQAIRSCNSGRCTYRLGSSDVFYTARRRTSNRPNHIGSGSVWPPCCSPTWSEVLKIERSVGGDDARAWGPPFLDNESLWFLSVNRNKKSVALDYSKSEGLDILRRLVR